MNDKLYRTVSAPSTNTSIDAIAAFCRLLNWRSPTYIRCISSYHYGLETAVEMKRVVDAQTAHEWMKDVLRQGLIWNDSVIFVNSHKLSDLDALKELNTFVLDSHPSAELQAESLALSRAFVQSGLLAWPCEKLRKAHMLMGEEVLYPCAAACAASGHGIALSSALQIWLNAITSNLISIAVGLVPLRENDGQKIFVKLGEVIRHVMLQVKKAALTDLTASRPIAVNYAG